MFSFYLPLSLCFLLVTPWGPIEKKMFCTIYEGFWQDFSRKEWGMHCFYINSPTGHSLCSAHISGIKNARIPSLFALKRPHAHILCLSHAYLYTHTPMHTYTNSLVGMPGVMPIVTMRYQWHHAKFRLVLNKFLMSKANRDYPISLRTREQGRSLAGKITWK